MAGLGAMALVVLVGAGAGPASATSGTGYDGTSPATTGCATGSYVIYSRNLYIGGSGAYVGAMEVRYSPACGTNWVRVYNQSTTDGVSQKYVERRAGNGLPYAQSGVNDAGLGWSYGNQIYASGSTCIWVQGGIVTGAWTAWSPYVQIC